MRSTERGSSRPKCADAAARRWVGIEWDQTVALDSSAGGALVEPAGADQLLGDVGGVAVEAGEAPRAPGVLPRQADEEHAGRRRDAAQVLRVAAAVEHRGVQPAVVAGEAGGPDDRGQVVDRNARTAVAVGPPYRVVSRGFAGRLDAVGLDEGVDHRVDAVVDLVGGVEVVLEVAGEAEPAVGDVAQATVQRHPLAGELAQVDVAAAVAAGHVVVGLVLRPFLDRLVGDRLVVVPGVLEPGDDVAAAV